MGTAVPDKPPPPQHVTGFSTYDSSTTTTPQGGMSRNWSNHQRRHLPYCSYVFFFAVYCSIRFCTDSTNIHLKCLRERNLSLFYVKALFHFNILVIFYIEIAICFFLTVYELCRRSPSLLLTKCWDEATTLGMNISPNP